MRFSSEARKEFTEKIEILKEEFHALKMKRHNSFLKNGKVDVDAYIAFVIGFNEFINHTPKPFEKIIDLDMRL